MEAMGREESVDPSDSLGVKGLSLLYRLNHGTFDVTQQLMPEAMHLAYCGVTKLFLGLTLKTLAAVNPSPIRRVSPDPVNACLLEVKVPSEVSNVKMKH